MKWYLKQKTLGWIALSIAFVLWGQLNRWSCVTKEPGLHTPYRGTWTSESVAYTANSSTRISEQVPYTTDRAARSSTPVKVAELRRLPQSPTAPESRRLPQSTTESESRRLPQSPTESESRRLPQSPTESESRRLPQSPTETKSRRLPQSPTAPESRRLPQSPTETNSRRLPPSPTAPDSSEVEVMGRLRVNRRKALLYGTTRATRSYLTIGIPTVRRQGVDYLEKTLYDLITHSAAVQQMSMVVIIFMADRNETWTKIRSKQLAGKYPKLIQRGFLQIVHPHDQSIYPDFNKLKRTYNDSVARIAWRSKQNIDYAYLFSYSQNISRYYLQLEDDVISTNNYYSDIVDFIDSKSGTFWYYLEFSHIGFIGKLIRSSDLRELSDYIMLFFAEQPCDLLLLALGHIKTQSKRIRITKSLFQHIGVVSSLPGKVQKITDKYFKGSSVLNRYARKKFYHVNPSANVDTNIEVFSDFKPVYAYDLSNTFFWGVSPRQGENFRITLDAPQNISRICIDTGIAGKESDILRDAKLLVSTRISDEAKRPCQNFSSVTTFVNGDVDTKKSNISLPVNIGCIDIGITANHTGWVIIREIAIFLLGEVEIAESNSNSPFRKPSKERTMIGNQERGNSIKPYIVPGESNGSVTVNTGDESVKQFERESDVKQKEISSVQNPVQQQYDSITKRDDTLNKYNSTGLNQFSRKRFSHANPPATIYTQIETFSDYKPVYAYDSSEAYFWGVYPKQGDYFLVLLKSPHNISRIVIDSGYEGRESDILRNARLLVSSRGDGEEDRTCQNLEAVGIFENGDIDTKILNNSLPMNIDCFVIEITDYQRNWLIIREIAVFLSGEKEIVEPDKNANSSHTREERKMLENRTLERNETLKRPFVSKQSIGPVQTKDPDEITRQRQNSPGHTENLPLNPHAPKESLDRQSHLHPIHQQINMQNGNDAENDTETRNVNRNVIDRMNISNDDTFDSRIKNNEDKNVQPTTSSLLQHHNAKLSNNIVTHIESGNKNPRQTNDAKAVEHFEKTDGNRNNVKRVPEIYQKANYTLEHRNKQKYDARQKHLIVNKKEQNQLIVNKTEQNQLIVNKKEQNETIPFSRKRFYHVNPPATIYTNIKTFAGHLPVYAYDPSDKYFWGVYPKKGDFFLILLHTPQNISRILIDSGHLARESDMLHGARLLVSNRAPGEGGRPCQKPGDVAIFVNGDVDTRISNISLPVNIDCIVIGITADQKDLLIIREIAVFLSGASETVELDKNTSSSPIKTTIQKQILDRRNDVLKPPLSGADEYSGHHLIVNKGKRRQPLPQGYTDRKRRVRITRKQPPRN